MLRVTYTAESGSDPVLAGPFKLSPPTPTHHTSNNLSRIYLRLVVSITDSYEATAATGPPAAASPSSQAKRLALHSDNYPVRAKYGKIRFLDGEARVCSAWLSNFRLVGDFHSRFLPHPYPSVCAFLDSRDGGNSTLYPSWLGGDSFDPVMKTTRKWPKLPLNPIQRIQHTISTKV